MKMMELLDKEFWRKVRKVRKVKSINKNDPKYPQLLKDFENEYSLARNADEEKYKRNGSFGFLRAVDRVVDKWMGVIDNDDMNNIIEKVS